MIQLNLLPDVKLEYIKAQRSRRLAISVSFIVAAASIGLLLMLLSLTGLQKKHLSDLTKDINKESSELQNQPQIDKILTVQNQLQSLTGLHATKPDVNRLFAYLNQTVPNQIDINNLAVDFTTQTATITGTADALSNVNKFVDTLKFTTYNTDTNTSSTLAFSNVVLSSFGLSTASAGGQSTNHPANYTITLSYDKNIFDTTQKVTLSVPELITTRSELAQPTDLFSAPTTTTTKKGTN